MQCGVPKWLADLGNHRESSAGLNNHRESSAGLSNHRESLAGLRNHRESLAGLSNNRFRYFRPDCEGSLLVGKLFLYVLVSVKMIPNLGVTYVLDVILSSYVARLVIEVIRERRARPSFCLFIGLEIVAPFLLLIVSVQDLGIETDNCHSYTFCGRYIDSYSYS